MVKEDTPSYEAALAENTEERVRVNKIVDEVLETDDFSLINQLRLADSLNRELASGLREASSFEEMKACLFNVVSALSNVMFMLAEERKEKIDNAVEKFTI